MNNVSHTIVKYTIWTVLYHLYILSICLEGCGRNRTVSGKSPVIGGLLKMSGPSTQSSSSLESEESLLYSARHGEVSVVKALLQAKREGKLNLNINCKGKNKTNLNWSPLHLATYFGHVEVVRILLEAGADIDEVNDTGDTALHKACYNGNEELVILLLEHKADVNIMNGEGRTPCEVCKGREVQRLVDAAGRAERVNLERALLTAAREGRVDEIQALLSSAYPPNINCADSLGNTCLHNAANRGHVTATVLLLQNGIDTTLRNHNGKLAIDLCREGEMRELLGVRPVQRLHRSAQRFEGALLKKSRFLGWRTVWGVLERGVLTYWSERGGGGRERGRHYLDGAGCERERDGDILTLRLSAGGVHRLALPPTQGDPHLQMQSWMTALKEHISFSSHYLWAGAGGGLETGREVREDLGDDCKPLGSMQDALTAAANNLSLLETQLKECAAIVQALEKTVNVGNSLYHSAYMRFQHVCGSGESALTSLRHCAALVTQARDADLARLNREIERNRVLEESLAALAKTHHALEMSVAEELTKGKRKKRSSSRHSASHRDSKESFYDVYDDNSDDDTLRCDSPLGALSDSPLGALSDSPLEALSAWGSGEHFNKPTPLATDHGAVTPRALSPVSPALSPASSLGTLVSTGGHVYRNARGHLSHHRHSSDCESV